MSNLPKMIPLGLFLLRPPEYRDAGQIYEEMLGDPYTVQALGYRCFTDVEQAYEFVAYAKREWDTGVCQRWVIEHLPTGRLAGYVGIAVKASAAELSLVMSRPGGTSRSTRGAIFAFKKIIELAQRQPEIYRLYVVCYVEGKSARLAEGLGFEREGIARNHLPLPNLGLVAADFYIYALTRPVREVGGPLPKKNKLVSILKMRATESS